MGVLLLRSSKRTPRGRENVRETARYMKTEVGSVWELLLLHWLLLDWSSFWDLREPLMNIGSERVKQDSPEYWVISSNYCLCRVSSHSSSSPISPLFWPLSSRKILLMLFEIGFSWPLGDCYSQLNRVFLSLLSPCGCKCSWPYNLSAHYQDSHRIVRNPKRDS